MVATMEYVTAVLTALLTAWNWVVRSGSRTVAKWDGGRVEGWAALKGVEKAAEKDVR
jgi:hypothetical protein